MVAADVYCPAAVRQLQTLGKQLGVPVYAEPQGSNSINIAVNGVRQAQMDNNSIVIVDTAGRLHIDEEMMEEVDMISTAIARSGVVVAPLTGRTPQRRTEFSEKIGITGVILTKMDGDSRGGAALSVRQVTGKPIKFIGMGEKSDALEPFHRSVWPRASSAWATC